MGFLLGSSCLSQYPSLMLLSHRKLGKKKKILAVMVASLQDNIPSDEDICCKNRRAFLFLGVSVLPLLELKAVVAEIPPSGQLGFEVLSQPTGFATIFLSPRNRNKNMKSRTLELPQDPTSEDKKGISMSQVQQHEQTKLESSSPDLEQLVSKRDLEQSDMQTSLQEAPRISSPVYGTPTISFVSLLNVIGILGSGVFCALYAASQKEKSAMKSTMKSTNIKFSEAQESAAALKEDLEKRLVNEQEQRNKLVSRLEEEVASLSTQLGSANGRIKDLSGDLQNRKKLLDESNTQLSQLESAIRKAREDKDQLEILLKEKTYTVEVLQDKGSLLTQELNEKEKRIDDLNGLLAKEESKCQNLSSIVDQTRARLLEANSTAKQLNEETLKIRKELQLKQSSIDRLNEKVRSLEEENCESSKRFLDLRKEYIDFKSSAEQRATFDSELLSKKDGELDVVRERLAAAQRDAGSKEAMISELEKGRDGLKRMLEEKADNMKELTNELQSTEDSLRASKLEASDLAKQLNETKRSYEVLMSRISKLRDEFHQENKLVINKLEEAKFSSEALSSELVSTRETLGRTKEELTSTSIELKEMMEDRESLKKELLEIYKKLELAAEELKEERSTVVTLNRELEIIKKQMLEDSKARKDLEADLDEATKSLDEMNKSALLLSRELEISSSRIASFEAENEILLQSVVKQKDNAREAQENVEDAQNLIIRLGNERESLELRANKLEEDLASTKGEILRLRKQISLNKESAEEDRSKRTKVVSATPFTAEKTVTKRRKGGSP
ncbi:MAR-binding filament-like protein 1 isoform X1 [Iris pallida]|uniref:MAR-binding filament-like protein 1 isoform X1 n=1 Tax=Iris pallida TaxID=29817 RepID=A0AAX6F5F9_IRIPA|nr:MAR-binding filament-like protein 1 isoform X1 [Iris pallida]